MLHRPLSPVRSHRVQLLCLAALVLAVCLAGCTQFASAPTGSQADVIGAAHVQTSICVDGFGDNATARVESSSYQPNTDCAANAAAPGTNALGGSAEGEVLVGYLVPDGSTAPQTLNSADLGGVTFTADSDYSTYLTANETTPSGSRWLGYMSDDLTLTAASYVNLDAAFTLPTNADGSPYSGTFATQEVVGDRVDGVFDGTPLDSARPLDCSETSPAPYPPPFNNEPTTSCVQDQNSVSVPTRDLGIVAPSATPTVAAGSSVNVPFSLQYAGTADPTATFALSAASANATKATATPADSQFTPTDNQTATENVTVQVPASLAPGTYHVTLTAADSDAACTEANACTRTQTAAFTVTSAASTPVTTTTPTTPAPPVTATPPPALKPAPKPKVHINERLTSVGRPTAGQLLAHGEQVRVSCNHACTVGVYLEVYFRAIGRGEKYRQLASIAGAERPYVRVVVGHTDVRLRTAGAKTVRVRVIPMPHRVLSYAGSILLGVYTAADNAQGRPVSKTHKHWVQVPGPDMNARVAARRHH